VRVVTFRPRTGLERELHDVVVRAPEINRRFGALRVWCLGGDLGMAIVSVWSWAEDLETMRADAE
jgi:hypothetical protein